MTEFSLTTNLEPKGSQPYAIKRLTQGIKQGYNKQTLLGVTGSGKSLAFSEKIFLRDKNGNITKRLIGDFVEELLTKPLCINDTEFQNISGFKILSFNDKNFSITEQDITQISRHKDDVIYTITLDDNSSIKITRDHNCYRFANCMFELCKTDELQIGDYLPTSNIILSPDKEFKFINLLDYNPTVKVYIGELITRHDVNQEIINNFFKKELRSPKWKKQNIINQTKERGITLDQFKKYLELTHMDLIDVNDSVKIITKGKDILSPLIAIDENFLFFLGIYIAEGHNTSKYILISNAEKIIQKKCQLFWKSLGLHYQKRNKNDISYFSIVLAKFFKIFGCTSSEKKIPDFIYNLSNHQLSIFLRGIFDGDGWVEPNSVQIMSASKELIFDIKNLLLRFGITSRINTRRVKGYTNKYYKLSITGKKNLLAYKKYISFTLDYKKERLSKSIKKNSNTNVDLIPCCDKYITEIRKKYNLSQKDLAEIAKCNRSYISMIEHSKRNPSKKIFLNIAQWIVKKDKHKNYLLMLPNFNLRKIISINKTKNPTDYVYDISVNQNDNFTAGYGNIFVHNTFTMAQIIQNIQKPTLVLAHNKTLAAQLYGEFKDFFPHNRVEYFVSYYDYYQPESYLPQKDQYIEKDADVNPKIEQMRLSATASLLSRSDVIVVSSVSCIYSAGDPRDYHSMGFELSVGDTISRTDILRKLIESQYERNDLELQPGRFRVKGDTIDLIPAYYDQIIRFEMFGDEIEAIKEINKITGDVTDKFEYYSVFPAKHFVIAEDKKEAAINSIKAEMEQRLPELSMLEAHRLKQRTLYDIEMLEETGFCKGIENYSRHFDGRNPGEKPFCLLDYFPKDFLMFIDESHRTIPQVHGMHHGDYSRKKTLIEYGFRLPSAFDNRPLTFDEFKNYMHNVIFVSATPGEYELSVSDQVVEQLIRPTGLVDPPIEVRKTEGQIHDLIGGIHQTISRGERVLVTTLTKKLAEELSEYLAEQQIKTRYLHSEIDTLERSELIRQLRLGEFDVLVGINLLREGIDIPEVGFIGILDADKEGFLRDERSLIQIIGRAARNVNSTVVLYADTITKSIDRAISETNRRRKIQLEYNSKHHITPTTIVKSIKEKVVEIKDTKHIPKKDIPQMIVDLELQMKTAADNLDFETAIQVRDRIATLKQVLRK